MDKLLEMIRTAKNTWEYTFTKKTSDISAFIDLKLQEKNMSRSEFAQKLGVGRSCVSHMLDGDTNFTIKNIAKMAVVLDTSFEEIVTYERPKRRPEPFNYEIISAKSSDLHYCSRPYSNKKESKIVPFAA